jgi:ABC-type transporter MlaC component
VHAAVMALGLVVAQTSATDALKARDAEIRKALPPGNQPITEAKRQRLAAVLTKSVDLPGMAQDAMGKRWQRLSPTERKKYVAAFSAAFRKASEGQIDSYRNSTITYDNETAVGGDAPNDVQVSTTLTIYRADAGVTDTSDGGTGGGEPTPVVYTLRHEGTAYKIVDVTVDGASTVAGYVTSFGRTYDKDGIAGLISKLQQRASGKD